MNTSTTTTDAPTAVDEDLLGLPTAPGFRLRRWRGLDADLPAMWAVSDRAKATDGEQGRTSLEAMATYYRHLERHDPDRDLVIAETDPGGEVAGYARVEWNDSNDGERWYEGIGIVDPAFRRRGIGTVLLAWSERRRIALSAELEAAAAAPTERPAALTTFVFDGDTGGRVLLENARYVPFRRFATMRRPDLESIPELPLPEGLEVRPATRELGLMRQVFEADVEAFRDHFGRSEASDEKFAEFVEHPDIDPELWIVAWDGDEVAGAVLNEITVNADGQRQGWLEAISTRRPWRRRGLARSLIARSLTLLREHGLREALLGVDLTNPHQALTLYESCGFEIISGATAFRKDLPPSDGTAGG